MLSVRQRPSQAGEITPPPRSAQRAGEERSAVWGQAQ